MEFEIKIPYLNKTTESRTSRNLETGTRQYNGTTLLLSDTKKLMTERR